MSRSESLPTGRRALHWMVWLGAGVLFGVLAGFVAALGTRGPDGESDDEPEMTTQPAEATRSGR